jgi:hypothetical protein
MDAQRSSIVSVVLVRSFVKAMSPTATDAQVRRQQQPLHL